MPKFNEDRSWLFGLVRNFRPLKLHGGLAYQKAQVNTDRWILQIKLNDILRYLKVLTSANTFFGENVDFFENMQEKVQISCEKTYNIANKICRIVVFKDSKTKRLTQVSDLHHCFLLQPWCQETGVFVQLEVSLSESLEKDGWLLVELLTVPRKPFVQATQRLVHVIVHWNFFRWFLSLQI